MLLAVRIEKLREHLAGLAQLVDAYERGDIDFPDRCLRWLDAAEQVMAQLRLPEGAEMASLRSSITRAPDDVPDRAEGTRASRQARARARNAAAASALSRAEAVMRGVILDAREQLQEYERKLVEAVTAAVLMGVLPLPPESPRESWLRRVWQALTQYEPTRPTTVYLASALQGVDRLWLLDEILSRLLDPELPVFEFSERD
jgi:hypothetical protein